MDTPEVGDVRRAIAPRYDLIDRVAAGGMGTVYRARHRQLGHLVAVKVLPPEVAASRARQERFHREARLAAHLSHPNVVPVYEFEQRAGVSYLVMPLIAGRTLESVLQDSGTLPLSGLLRWLSDVGAALDYAHARGIVHRDVKPANILIESDTGRALLTDFGVAQMRGSPEESLTAPGSTIGTPDYMAPEQASGGRLDGRADLYALAMVVFEALTGHLPAWGADRGRLAAELRAARHELTPALSRGLVEPLAERPGDRPPTASAWIARVHRAARPRWPRRSAVAAVVVILGLAGWTLASRLHRPAAPTRSLAAMPFTMLGANPDFPPAQLPTWLLQRLGAVPQLQIISAAKISALTGGQSPGVSDADSAARRLGATYFVQPSLELRANRARLSMQLYETQTGRLLGTGTAEGPPDSLSQLMDAVWAQVLPAIVRQNFALTSAVTMPHGLPAMLAYASAEEAFRQGDYNQALADYDRVLAADSQFSIAYFRRAIVVGQVDPREERFRRALAGARLHQTGLAPADSLLLDGYRLLLDRGDGRAALERFKAAADLAPDQPQVWFTLGEFSYHFGALFDQPILEAETAFNHVLDLVPNFAPAIAHLISLAHLRGDDQETARLIAAYQRFDTHSVVAEAVGIADTLLLQGLPARRHLLETADQHSLTALEYLAFQAQTFGTDGERRGPLRDILAALERRAVTDSQRVLALRFGVAADLGEGWADSARARLRRAVSPIQRQERDHWILLARVTGLDSLGDWRAAAQRLDPAAGGAMEWWMRARLNDAGPEARTHLERLAADSAPLARSLAEDLAARAALAAGDTLDAIRSWQEATTRYAVLRVPFDLVASLWPLRRDLARVAAQHGDSLTAARACRTFDAPIGYVDVVLRPDIRRLCAPLRHFAIP
jgi:serine/threonine protein kinase/tetratricopeptide (TPR) repeat protein